MRVQEERYDVGVIVGRFQVPNLHPAHRDLIDHVCDKHSKVVVFLGESAADQTTRSNPMDFEARRQMVSDAYPTVNILYIKDKASDEVWSETLDDHIATVASPSQSVVLYGSRDSFISHYTGRYPTCVLETDQPVSGTSIREEVARSSTVASPDFRAGVVWASFNRFPTCYPTVDIAVFDHDTLLLGKKPGEPQWRLIGGFADPRSPSYEADARREVVEETGIEITDPVYVGSFLVDDWRYKGEPDKIKTTLFNAKRFSGTAVADDDIEKVMWADIWTLNVDRLVMPNHRHLVRKAIEYELNTRHRQL